MKLSELAKRVEAELVGNGEIEISSVSTLENAVEGQISFLANPKYLKQLRDTQASAVIVHTKVDAGAKTVLKVKDPYYTFSRAVVELHGYRRHPFAGVHPGAYVDSTATIGPGTVIYPGAFVGPRCKVGADCIFYPNAVVYDECIVGDRVILHAGCCVGVDGFGFATHQGVHHKIPQVGNVVLGDDVEIGACAVIARAALGSTTLGNGTKVDAQVMVGHNAEVGAHGLLVAQAGIAGSTTLGHHVTIAAQAGIAGHLKIGDNAVVAAKAGVMRDIDAQTINIGMPAMPALQARRVYSIFTQLPELVERLRQLEKQVEELGTLELPNNEAQIPKA